MNIYLVRHGEAFSPIIDPKRPLTEYGEAMVTELTKRLVGKSLKVDQIYHSEILRAKQTAEIIQARLKAKPSIAQMQDLLPESNPQIWLKKLHKIEDNVMLVGHMPYMAFLAELLMNGHSLGGFSTASLMAFKKGDQGFHLIWNSQHE